MKTATITKTVSAKEKLKALRANSGTITLTHEVCKLIMEAGGPTYYSVSGGYRCNQTGEFVGNATQNHRTRVGNMAVPPKRVAETQTKSRQISSPYQSGATSLPRAFTNFGYSHCPNNDCGRMLGIYSSLRGTTQTCSFCRKQCRVI